MKKQIKQYYKACEGVKDLFIETYYTYDDGSIQDFYWIGGIIGGVLNVGDEFWNIDDMVTAIEMRATIDDLYDWHWDRLGKEGFPNLENYLKQRYYEGFKKKD